MLLTMVDGDDDEGRIDGCGDAKDEGGSESEIGGGGEIVCENVLGSPRASGCTSAQGRTSDG